MNPKATYVFENGKVYAMVGQRVVASADTVDELERKIANPMDPAAGGGMGGHEIPDQVDMPPVPGDLGDQGLGAGTSCPQCQAPAEPGDQFCSHCGSPLGHEDEANFIEQNPGINEPELGGGAPDQPLPPMGHGAHVITPNGLKGQILGKVAGLWEDEVTVRFENGRIVRLPASAVTVHTEKVASSDPVGGLETRLAASVDGTRESLEARVAELEAIKREARSLISKASHDNLTRLDSIVVQADYEMSEINDAAAHLADLDGQGFQAPAPIENMPRVEQATLGGGDASWLDHTVNDMIAEAEATDYEKLMDEGPEGFVAELGDAPLADAGVVRQMAARHIRSKTAGAEQDVRDRYESAWLDRVEQVRRSELQTRKVATHKEAASQEQDFSNLPDDVLFS